MRFGLTNDQVAFRDAVRDLLAKDCTPAHVRAASSASVGQLDCRVWDGLDAMGVLTVLVAEADGGLGLDETYLVPVLEECGRVALPHPIVETAMVAAPLFGAGAGMVSTDLGSDIVPWGLDADTLLLLEGGQLVRSTPSSIAMVPIETVDHARRAATRAPGGLIRRQDSQEQSPDCEIVTDDQVVIDLAFDRGALGTAAMLVGLGQKMLDLTVGYVQQRQQFGKPIGSFQAVKHHLADAALALEFARPAVQRAAWTTAHGGDQRTRDVSMAKALASDAAQLVGRKALQCHGAIGYTVEADMHLYLKRTWALARSWGDIRFHTDRVADALRASGSDPVRAVL